MHRHLANRLDGIGASFGKQLLELCCIPRVCFWREDATSFGWNFPSACQYVLKNRSLIFGMLQYIRNLDISADMHGQGKFPPPRPHLYRYGGPVLMCHRLVTMTVNSTGTYSEAVTVSVIGEGGDVIASHDASSNKPFTFVVDSPKLWSPDSPTL